MVSIRWDPIDPENLDQLRGVDQKLIDIVLIYDKICHNSWTNIVGASNLWKQGQLKSAAQVRRQICGKSKTGFLPWWLQVLPISKALSNFHGTATNYFRKTTWGNCRALAAKTHWYWCHRSLSDGCHQSGKLLREGVHEGDKEEENWGGRRWGEGETSIS